MTRVVLMVAALLAAGFAGCITADTEPGAGTFEAASPDEAIRHQLDAMEPVELGGGGVIRIEGPTFVAIPITGFQEFAVSGLDWSHKGDRDDAVAVFIEPVLPRLAPDIDEEPRHQHGGPDDVCGGSGAWHWSSLQRSRDATLRELQPGRYNLYVSISTGAVRLAFNHIRADAEPIADIPALDVSHVYSAELLTLRTETTHGARTEVAATWDSGADGPVFARGAWSVTFTGVGTDAGHVSEWRLDDDGCQSLGRGYEATGLERRVAGSLPAAFHAGTQAAWHIEAFLEGPGTVKSAEARILHIQGHADVVHAPWF